MDRLGQALERWNLRLSRVRQRLVQMWERLDARSAGWLGVGERTYRGFVEHKGDINATAIAYYTLFSIFPLILGLISLGSFVLDSAEAQEAALALVAKYSPAAVELVEDNIQQVLAQRGTFGIIAALGFLWSATGVFGALSRAINAAWEVKRPRPVWAERALALGLVLLIALLFFLSLYSTVAFELVYRLSERLLGETPWPPGSLLSLVTAILPFVFTVLFFPLIYRVLPHAPVTWADVLPPAILASLVWEVAKYGFAFYATRFAFYSLVYGSLSAVVIFLLWSYISGVIILLGAELSVQYARRRGRK